MRRREWKAIAAGLTIMAITACGGGDQTADQTTGDTAAVSTPTSPAAATSPAGTPGTAPTGGSPPPGATAAMVSEGQQVFTTNPGICVTCHGPDAKGTQLAPNLTDSEWINNDGTYNAIINTIKTGVPTPKNAPAAMPPMGGAQLTEDQIRAVAAYVWSLGGGKQ